MKKRLLSIMLGAMILIASAGFACGGDPGNTVIKDGKTVNVKVSSAGYGTTFVTALAEKFNDIYKDKEGYKINVLPPQSYLGDTNLLQDIYSESGVDVYWSSVSIRLALEGTYGECLTDLTESVFSKPAIKFDGTEEDKTISEKVANSNYDISILKTVVYDGKDANKKDKFYGVPTTIGSAGFATNLRVLEEYGLEIPKTTNEMWNCVDVIMNKAATTRVFPFAYSISGNGYTTQPLQYWLAQYRGVDGYKKFWSMQDENGNNLEKPYEVFASDGIEEILKDYYRMYDENIGSDGSKMQDFTSAQAQIMMGDAAFMCTGSWMYNEEHLRYGEYTKDVTFIKLPVTSALGVKLFGDKYDADKCDKILSAICDGTDAGKEVEEIKSDTEKALNVSLDLDDVSKAVEARGIVLDRSGSAWYISSKASDEIKEIASLFLRMCASEEGARLMGEHTSETQFFALDMFSDSSEPWFKGTSAMLFNKHVKACRAETRGYRLELGVGDAMFPYMTTYPVNHVMKQGLTVYDSRTLKKVGDLGIFSTAATECASELYNHAKKQFEDGIWKVKG